MGEGAVGIIFSGSGNDGTSGAEAINAANGTVLVQAPEESVQPGMPEAAIAAGVADLIGSTERITAWLNDIANLASKSTLGHLRVLRSVHLFDFSGDEFVHLRGWATN